MRIVALEAMKAIAAFEPRLIGSVSTGHIRKGSDVDLSVFTDDDGALETHLRGLRWAYDREPVSIQKFGEIREYLHYHVADVFPVELTVYPVRELRFRPRSSTDGKPIVRVRIASLRALLLRDHAEAWAAYLKDGTIDGIDLADEDEEGAGPGAVRRAAARRFGRRGAGAARAGGRRGSRPALRPAAGVRGGGWVRATPAAARRRA